MRRAILALPRLVAVWLRAAPSAIFIVVTVVALTSFLATAAPLWFVRSADAALPSLLDTVSPSRSGLEFEQPGRIDPGETDQLAGVRAAGDDIRAGLPGSLDRIVAQRMDLIDSPELLAIGPPQPITHLTLRIEPAIADAIHFYAGRAPTNKIVPLHDASAGQDEPQGFAYEVGLSRTTATTLKVGVGDQLVLSTGSVRFGPGPIGAEIVGLFDELDPTAPVWFGDTTLDAPGVQQLGQELFDYHAIGLLAPDAYTNLLGGGFQSPLRYRWRFTLDLDQVASIGIDRLSIDLARLQAAHPFGASGSIGAAGLSTGLPPLIALYRSQRAIAGTALALASVGAIVASAGALALVAAALARRRSSTVRLARARGADLRRLLAVEVVEAIALVLPAAGLGAAAAVALLARGGDPGGPGGAIVVGLGAAVLLVLAGVGAARSSLASGRQQTERTVDARNRRRVLDALVVIVAVATALALRSSGTTTEADPTAPPDPFRTAAPALLAVAGAIVILRLFDAVVAGLARLVRRGRGLVGVHAVRGLARGPRTHELPLLVLLVAVAAGVFATAVATTIERTQDLAAATDVGADYRIESIHPGGLPTNLDFAALAAIGPTAVAARDEGTLLGIGWAGQAVDVVALDVPGYAAVTAGTVIAPAYPPGFLDTPPADGSPGRPVPIVVAQSVASDTGLRTGTAVRLSMGFHEVNAVVAGIGDLVPATSLGRGILAPRDALRAAFPDRTLLPTQAFVRGGQAARAAIQTVLEPYRASLRLTSRADAERALHATPLVDTMSEALPLAQVVAALYAAVVVGAAVSQALAARSAELSLLRAIGLPGFRAVGIVVIELGSTVLVALVGGLGPRAGDGRARHPGPGHRTVRRRRRGGAGRRSSRRASSWPWSRRRWPGCAALVVAGRALGSSGLAAWIRSAET